jgi:hypothetical protein
VAKQFLALLCALVLQSSVAQEPKIIDKHEDWIISDVSPRVVTMYRNVTAVGPAQFNVEMQSLFKPGAVKYGSTNVVIMHGVLSVNCIKRTTRVILDKSYDDSGEHIAALDNKFSERDIDAPPKSGAQGMILYDLCGASDIEWSET